MAIKKHLTRRKILQHATSLFIGGALYRTFRDTEAYAADSNERFSLFVYVPAGITADQWFPTGTETDFKLPLISSPLEAIKEDIVIFQGLNTVGPGNHSGGPQQVFAGGGADGTQLNSLDQTFASNFGSDRLFPRFALGLGSTQSNDGNLVSWKNGAGIATPDNPVVNFQNTFGSFNSPSPGETAEKTRDLLQGKKRIIDFLKADVRSVENKLSGDEKQFFQNHINSLDDISKEVQKLASGATPLDSASCGPENIDFSTIDQTFAYYPKWYHKTENISAIAQVNREMMIQAFACGLTRVGLMQFGASNTQIPLNFIGKKFSNSLHHTLSHEATQDFWDTQKAIVSEAVAICQALKKIPIGDGSNALRNGLDVSEYRGP